MSNKITRYGHKSDSQIIDSLRAENDALCKEIESLTRQRDLAVSAIENLVKQKGRHNTEIAYKKLVDVLATIKESEV